MRFFSFFTVLTNILAAIMLTAQASDRSGFSKPGTITAITVYITIVGAVYQILLRHIWHPTGLQMIVDELLHSVNPLLVIFYWCLFERKGLVNYTQISGWLIYPLVYLLFILARGSFSGFYPYPFINVTEIGLAKALINSLLLLLVFSAISLLFIFAGKLISKQMQRNAVTN
ncbi:MAG: Pr6Pr family membrane protein [Ferruginibacter sp.]